MKTRNWMMWSFAASAIYFVLLAAVIGLRDIADFFTTRKELNEIGDFLAGVFALPAFMVLVAAVLTQRQELNETRGQFEESKKVTSQQLGQIDKQNRLALVAAKANYRFLMYEKRKAIYDRLMVISAKIAFDAHLTVEHLSSLAETVRDVKFIFGPEVQEYARGIEIQLEKYRDAEERLNIIDKAYEMHRHAAIDRERRNIIVHELATIEQSIFDGVDTGMIDTILGPSLKLPDELDFGSDQSGGGEDARESEQVATASSPRIGFTWLFEKIRRS